MAPEHSCSATPNFWDGGYPTGLHSRSKHDKTVQGISWADVLQRKDSDAAIDSCWRCKLVKILLILGSWGGLRVFTGAPPRSQGVPREIHDLFMLIFWTCKTANIAFV